MGQRLDFQDVGAKMWLRRQHWAGVAKTGQADESASNSCFSLANGWKVSWKEKRKPKID